MADDDVPGIDDVPRLGRWLQENGITATGALPRVRLIAGGRSNLTYLLEPGDEAAPLVLRRPPLGHVLPTAHDMSREYRVLSALAGTEVPVPAPVALYPEPDVIGAPFYLMQYVPGLVLRSAEDGERLTAVQARQLSEDFTDMLAAIHGVDLAATGLSGFGRPEGYMERQLARWQRQWELSASREVPGYTELTQRLTAGLPGRALPTPEGTLVHGDYRLDNTLVTLDREASDPAARPGPRSRPCWTGRCPPWATRWPTSGWPSSTGRSRKTVTPWTCSGPRRSPPARGSSPGPRSPTGTPRRPGGT